MKILGFLPASRWKHSRRLDAQEIEGLLLSGRRSRGHLEAFGAAKEDVVHGDGREVGDQGVEACTAFPSFVRSRTALLRAEGGGFAGSTDEARCDRAVSGSSSSDRIGASPLLMCHSAWQAFASLEHWLRKAKEQDREKF